MAQWRPIRRTNIDVHGVVEDRPGLLEVSVHLDRDPPGAWAQLFESGSGVPMSMSMHRPTLEGDCISIRPPDDELERYVAHVDERIAATNEKYENEVLPKTLSRQKKKGDEERRQAERIERAKKVAEGL